MLKISSRFSNRFPVNRGTRQGDILSPALFNLFVNDVVSAVTNANPTPALLDGCSVTALLYADDLILLSTSEKGLQLWLNSLCVYYSLWKMEINIKKSKVLAFEKRRSRNLPEFFFDNNKLESVDNYTYLYLQILIIRVGLMKELRFSQKSNVCIN
jgi:hypothetical protein